MGFDPIGRGSGADDHEQALRVILEPGLDVDAIGPDVDIPLGGQIAITPAEGKKELVGLADGIRESAQSWKELLLDLKRRGLTIGPQLAVAGV